VAFLKAELSGNGATLPVVIFEDTLGPLRIRNPWGDFWLPLNAARDGVPFMAPIGTTLEDGRGRKGLRSYLATSTRR